MRRLLAHDLKYYPDMMTTRHDGLNELSTIDQIAFERAVANIEDHPGFVRLDGPTQRQINDIIRFARTSPDKHVYATRLLQALAA